MSTTERDRGVDRRPVDARTGRPIGPMAQPGYYPGYHTLDQRNFWDAKTREVVLDRVENVPPIRFFTPEQAELLRAIADRIIPQDDRDERHRIPIVPRIDKRLYEDRHDGYRHEDMPPDREAFPLGLEGIQAIARHLHGSAFPLLGPHEQDEVLESVHHGKPPAGEEIWGRLPVHRFWMLLVKDCAEAY
ncbi:MAG TPA: gluconate 2-dehydrogenase subunit 3 family protein, partial [Bryobacteraceae bacterium]|nr:gluconate 2-dehydrogenase subunit 3 family protein [Bryobacteraceae bacterium]